MLYRICMLTIALLWSASCSEPIDDGAHPKSEAKTTLVIGCSREQTRTSLGENLTTTRWSVGDKIALWAQAEGGGPFALDAMSFTLHTYNSTFSSADFSSHVEAPMTEGDYTYFAVYPTPTTHEGTKVSYTLPATQNGQYDGTLDVMAATPVKGRELGNYALDGQVFNFRHLTHMMRLEIPRGRNLFGRGIRRLAIEFPTEVVGNVSFDAADPFNTVVFENGSRTVNIDFDGEGLGEQQAVYLFLRPCELSGTITFYAYDADGFMAKAISTQIDTPMTMDAGRGTKLSLTIPEARPFKIIDFKVTSNNLGEDLTNIQVNAPAGTGFIEPFTPQSKETVNITPNAEGIFRTGVYTDEYTLDMLQGQTLKTNVESENVEFKDWAFTLPTQITEATAVEFPMEIPYLFEENFSKLTSFSKDDNNKTNGSNSGNNNAVNLNTSGAGSLSTGWTGARCGGQAGQAMRICCRGENVNFFISINASYTGRIDCPPMSNIKEGKTVKLRLQFNYSLNKAGNKTSNHQHYLTAGEHKVSGVRNPTVSGLGDYGSTISDSSIAKDLKTTNNGSYTNIYQTADFVFEDCTNASRFAWEVYLRSKTGDGYHNNWAYIDNIKVSISK